MHLVSFCIFLSLLSGVPRRFQINRAFNNWSLKNLSLSTMPKVTTNTGTNVYNLCAYSDQNLITPPYVLLHLRKYSPKSGLMLHYHLIIYYH